ncbi:hypothetical protein JB92DRAFT_64336 [Gautieria morchelliformis]|nr:hypothetical protein JB92DRAFT_64336 [Gautieria morchelliformis]
MFPPSANTAFTQERRHVQIRDHLALSLLREGGLKSLELKGVLNLGIADLRLHDFGSGLPPPSSTCSSTIRTLGNSTPLIVWLRSKTLTGDFRWDNRFACPNGDMPAEMKVSCPYRDSGLARAILQLGCLGLQLFALRKDENYTAQATAGTYAPSS